MNKSEYQLEQERIYSEYEDQCAGLLAALKFMRNIAMEDVVVEVQKGIDVLDRSEN